MNFDALKDQLRDQWNELLGKIQENSYFQTFKERFEALSVNAQRTIIILSIVFAVLFVLSFPYSYVSSSHVNLATFEENRGLIRDLLQASRTAKEPSPLPSGISGDALKSQITSILTENRLIPEQIVDVQEMNGKPAGKLAPPVVEQAGIAVSLKKLNLRQIVDLGHRFQSLSAGIKVMSMDIVRSNNQSHYYDVVFKIVNFSLPSLTADLSGGGGGGSARSRIRPRIPPSKNNQAPSRPASGQDAEPPPDDGGGEQ